MNHIDFIQLNKFCQLHNNQTIFFCKTDFIVHDFQYISQLDCDVIFITGNSDYPITDHIVNKAPKNIKKWFAQNALSHSSIIEPLPIGLENKIASSRIGHGIGYYERMIIKEKYLSENLNNLQTKNIYANFTIETNPGHRLEVQKYCILNKHICWENPTLSLESWFETIRDYKMMVCPSGNGIDTHRLWEALYLNIIPITIKVGDYKIYELYNKLPIIILSQDKDLLDTDLIYTKYHEVINKKYDHNILTYNYWKSKILSYV